MSRAEMAERAAASETAALRCERNAKSGEEYAADPAQTPATRDRAAAAAKLGRSHAQEYRDDAADLRAGRMPGEEW